VVTSPASVQNLLWVKGKGIMKRFVVLSKGSFSIKFGIIRQPVTDFNGAMLAQSSREVSSFDVQILTFQKHLKILSVVSKY
jgi:hypothetical protein